MITAAQLEIIGQLAMALGLGFTIGFERNIAHKTAGMRTFALVSMGAALFTIVSRLAFLQFSGSAVDPTRIVAQIVVGIGFLAGGVIIFNHRQVQGLTTSAGLWVSGGIGMAVGFGLYLVAGAATFLTLFILVALSFIERRVVGEADEDRSSHENVKS